ncbi:hypothetical protein QFZ91_001001 [Paraburkholderia sp. JPY419]
MIVLSSGRTHRIAAFVVPEAGSERLPHAADARVGVAFHPLFAGLRRIAQIRMLRTIALGNFLFDNLFVLKRERNDHVVAALPVARGTPRSCDWPFQSETRAGRFLCSRRSAAHEASFLSQNIQFSFMDRKYSDIVEADRSIRWING